jgi:hypothetical protein
MIFEDGQGQLLIKQFKIEKVFLQNLLINFGITRKEGEEEK